MNFIELNELTTEQRAHIAAFIMNWPVNAVRQERIDQLKALATSVRMEQPTEEQRLDAEQKSDMDATGELREISGAEEAYAIGAAQADNLNDIFGKPKSSAVPLDSQGLPWDSRIHASTKTFVADGSWKLRRGVDPTEVEKVKAQLKELMAVPQALVTDLHRGASTVHTDQVHNIDPSSRIPVPVLTPTSVGYVPAPTIIPQLAEIAPPISGPVGVPKLPSAPAPVLTPTSVGYVPPVPVPATKSHYLIDQVPTVTLTDLIGRMSAAIAAGTLTQANIAEICTKHGVSEFHLLSNRPDLLPLIDADMKAMGV